MNQPKFIMMCGLVCSGKSTRAQELSKEYDAIIFSSDELRAEIFGDVNDQSHNQELFAELHRRIKECLKSGKSAVFDATNISYKLRMAFLAELKKIPCEKICVLMATPYEWCLERNAKRERKVPEHVIERMYRNFDPVWYYEGWDEVEVEYAPGSEGLYGPAREWVEWAKTYNQDNSHHTLTLGEHCWQVYKNVNKYEQEHPESRSADPATLVDAAMLHDVGKPFCKTFLDAKGEPSEDAHYYTHERCGSYSSLFYETSCYNLRMAVIIRWHMQPYFNKTDKAKEKYRKLWGEDLHRDIMVLHEADRASK